MSYSFQAGPSWSWFVDSFRAGPGWNCSSILVLLESYVYSACMTYTIAECTVNELLVMDRGTVRNMYSFMAQKFVELVHLVGFIIKKLLCKIRTILHTDKAEHSVSITVPTKL